MPKLLGRHVGKLIECEGKNAEKDFSYALGRMGSIEFYQSQKLHPGLVFARYYFFLDDDDFLFTERYIFTACGDLEIDGNVYTIRNTRPNGSTFVFEITEDALDAGWLCVNNGLQ